MVVRRFRGVVVGAALGGAIVAGAGSLGASGASAASSFSLTGTLMVANVNTHRISVLVGGSRHSIVVTARTRVFVRRHQMTMFALRARMRVSVQGLVQSRWREALVIRVGPGPVPVPPLPAPANGKLKSALNAALERERYAVASYQNVIAQLGAVRPFVNILASEQVHVATLRAFFEEYGLQMPSATVSGAKSPGSWTESCGLGSSIERSLVALYDRQIPLVSGYSDVRHAFSNFRSAAANNHAAAFAHC